MRRVIGVLGLALLLLFSGVADGLAAKKKKTQAPAQQTASTAMKVFIVRSSDVRCEPLCPEWISAEGDITGATPAAFRKVFKRMGKKQLPILIQSPGGSINAALEIGRMIRQRKLDVAVAHTFFFPCSPAQPQCKLPAEQDGIYRGSASPSNAYCNSACPLILAAGQNRYVGYGVAIGVHQPKSVWVQRPYKYLERYRIVKGRKKVISRKITQWLPQKTKVRYGFDKRLRKQLTAYYASMGVDPAILTESDKAAFKDVNYLTDLQLTQLKVRTSAASIEGYTDGSTCARMPSLKSCVRSALAPASKNIPAYVYEPSPSGISTVQLVRLPADLCREKCAAWISVSGPITRKTADRVRAIVVSLGKLRVPVFISSSGGGLEDAIALGHLVQAYKLDVGIAGTRLTSVGPDGDVRGTLAEGTCQNACLLVLAAADMKMASGDVLLSFRHPATFVPNDNPGAAVARVRDYLVTVGAHPDLAHNMEAASPVVPTVVRPADALRLRLITNRVAASDMLASVDCSALSWRWACLSAR